MLEKQMGCYCGPALLILRACVGIVFAAHGAQKLFGMFGGAGMDQTIAGFVELGIFYPTASAWLVSVIECFGGLALIAGFLTRENAFLIFWVMAGAIYYVHGANGFFLQNSGFEYNLMLMGACASLFCAGGSEFSLDRLMFPRSRWRFVKDPSSIRLEPPSEPPVF